MRAGFAASGIASVIRLPLTAASVFIDSSDEKLVLRSEGRSCSVLYVYSTSWRTGWLVVLLTPSYSTYRYWPL